MEVFGRPGVAHQKRHPQVRNSVVPLRAGLGVGRSHGVFVLVLLRRVKCLEAQHQVLIQRGAGEVHPSPSTGAGLAMKFDPTWSLLPVNTIWLTWPPASTPTPRWEVRLLTNMGAAGCLHWL